MENQPIILPDPHGRGWFIVVNSDHCDADGNHGMSSKILGKQDGYRDYHEAAAALAEMQA